MGPATATSPSVALAVKRAAARGGLDAAQGLSYALRAGFVG
jgi:hypothetical protein